MKSRFIGSIKHPIHKELGYEISVWENKNTTKNCTEICLSWYDFSGEDYKFLTSEWAILKINEMLNCKHEYLNHGGGSGRNWMILQSPPSSQDQEITQDVPSENLKVELNVTRTF